MLMRDIYCSANIVLKQHGKDAKAHATERVQEFRAAGNEKGTCVWMGIVEAIRVLEMIEPLEGQAIH